MPRITQGISFRAIKMRLENIKQVLNEKISDYVDFSGLSLLSHYSKQTYDAVTTVLSILQLV
jgi:hypothetical protein